MAAWLAAALLTAATPVGVADGGVSSWSFGPGESLTYEVTYFGAPAGVARIEVGSAAPRGGVPTWPVVVTANSGGVADKIFPVRDRYVDWWDPVSASSMESGLTALEGGHRSGFHIRYERHPDGGVAAQSQTWEGDQSQTTRSRLQPNSQDVLSAIFWLRTQRLLTGDHYAVPVFTGKVEWVLGASVIGAESVATAMGPIACVHVRLSAKFTGRLGNRRDLDAYFSADPRHLPVLLDSEVVIGRLKVTLTRVEGDRSAGLLGASH